MRQPYTDLYVLFRHDSRAQEYFDHLPAHVQDRISAQYRQIDSLDRLQHFAARYHAPPLSAGGHRGPDLPAPAGTAVNPNARQAPIRPGGLCIASTSVL